jgi:hypothetical protein
MAITGSAEAAPDSAAPPGRPDFGTSDRILYRIGASEFTPFSTTIEYSQHIGRYTISAGGALLATPHLPSGAILTYLELDYCDNSTAPLGTVTLQLMDCNFLGSSCRFAPSLSSDDGNPGCNYVWVDMTPLAWTIDNNSRQYTLTAMTNAGGPDTQLLGAYIGYKLQVSPAPAVATFADVPTTHPFFQFIEALVASGITAGCGGGNFCPDTPLTRGQMAVFLAAALGLHFPN